MGGEEGGVGGEDEIPVLGWEEGRKRGGRGRGKGGKEEGVRRKVLCIRRCDSGRFVNMFLKRGFPPW